MYSIVYLVQCNAELFHCYITGWRNIDDHHRNPNINDRDHLFGQLTCALHTKHQPDVKYKRRSRHVQDQACFNLIPDQSQSDTCSLHIDIDIFIHNTMSWESFESTETETVHTHCRASKHWRPRETVQKL